MNRTKIRKHSLKRGCNRPCATTRRKYLTSATCYVSRAENGEYPLMGCICSRLVKLSIVRLVCLFVWLFGFLTSSSTTRLYRGRVPRLTSGKFYVPPHTRQSWETMTSVSAGHIILTPIQPVGSGRPPRESNPEPPHHESSALLPRYPPPPAPIVKQVLINS